MPESPEKVRARAKAWYNAHADLVIARSKAWYKAHPEQKRAYQREWMRRKRGSRFFVGDLMICILCYGVCVRKAGNQIMCPDCRKEQASRMKLAVYRRKNKKSRYTVKWTDSRKKVA